MICYTWLFVYESDPRYEGRINAASGTLSLRLFVRIRELVAEASSNPSILLDFIMFMVPKIVF